MLKKKRLICKIIACLILLKILKILTGNPPKLSDLFRYDDPLTPTEYELLEELLDVVDNVLRSKGITYWMIEGTLIGSYRHHGRIPWDDDADIIVNNSMRARVTDVLDNYEPSKYRIFSKKVAIDSVKFYSLKGRAIKGWEHKAPYVDIYFFDEYEGYFLRADLENRKHSMLIKDVMPLSLRPYGRLWLPAPCNSSHSVATFNIANCILPIYNHLDEAPIGALPPQILCQLLNEKVAWVKRHPLVPLTKYGGGLKDDRVLYSQREELMIGDRKLGEVTIEGVCRD